MSTRNSLLITVSALALISAVAVAQNPLHSVLLAQGGRSAPAGGLIRVDFRRAQPRLGPPIH